MSTSDLKKSKDVINLVLQEGFDNEYISKEEFIAMKPEGKGPGKFYTNFKVHKQHEHGTTPPVRPIVSGCGSTTENLGTFVEHHLKPLANKHTTYLQDTPDFLRQVQPIKELPKSAKLVTIDVVGLFTNLPQDETVQCVREALEERQTKEVPTEYITRLLELILKFNIFEFSEELYIQLIGTAMGSQPAPDCANFFMARRVDDKIPEIAQQISENGENPITFMKRFLDDIFMIFTGSVTLLHKLVDQMNCVHPNIKFTMSHTSEKGSEPECDCKQVDSIPFLDTLCTIKNGKVVTDLYRKPSDRNQYLLTSSCHPSHVTENIPFSQCLRIVRICTEEEAKEKRFLELKALLVNRKYPENIINAAISKARLIPRLEALKSQKPPQPTNRRPIFVVQYDPRLPDVTDITHKQYNVMIKHNQYMKDVFPEPPLIANKRNKNIKDLLVRAKLPVFESGRPKRLVTGMKKCGKSCPICPFINETKTITGNNFNWKIGKQVTCETNNIIYLIHCDKCQKRYIGESERSLKDRISEHKGYIKNKHLDKATGSHFNERGHNIENMKVCIIEKTKKSSDQYRKERERFFIQKFNTYHNGINRAP